MVSAHDRRSSLNVSPLADVVAPWSGFVPVEVRPSPPLLSSKVNVEGNRADAFRPPIRRNRVAGHLLLSGIISSGDSLPPRAEHGFTFPSGRKLPRGVLTSQMLWRSGMRGLRGFTRLGVALVPMRATALFGVEENDDGEVRALANTIHQVGGALGVASFTSVATAAIPS